MKQTNIQQQTRCYHCGNDCEEGHIEQDAKVFCCNGCREVYSILSQSGLCNYYTYNAHPGAEQKKESKRFDYLKEPSIVKDLIDYSDEKFTIVTFYIPNIHCSSCIWLLEQLNRINPAIYYSRVDFLRKQVNIRFNNKQITLHDVVEVLERIGYEPLISLQDVIRKQGSDKNDNLVKKIAVAGFCFGNVMLLSFPEYLGISVQEQSFREFFGWLNLVFCLPVVLYCASGYFVSAWTNLKNKVLNIDLPLAIGITVLFLRTAAEIIMHTGPGFADTCCGLVFFLLIGKFVQRKTYYHLSFERDYRSFFPVAVQVIEEEKERSVPLADIQVGQRILIRNNEIIPADAILLKGEGKVDFSFVTGESVPVEKVLGEVVYAGGRQTGEAIELEVVKPVSQSYLTRLWNNEAFTRLQDNHMQTFSEKASKYFTIVLLGIALGSFLFWLPVDLHRGISAFTAVLIIACPCALALSTPFTMAAALSIFDKNLFYLKNTAVVEQLAHIDTIVLDKTGTITVAGGNTITLHGEVSDYEKELIYSACSNSAHPLSRLVCQFWNHQHKLGTNSYYEIPGRGITADIDRNIVDIGSERFIRGSSFQNINPESTEVHIRINNIYKGYFSIKQHYREGIKSIKDISSAYKVFLLSGDHGHERETLSAVFKPGHMFFEQSPQDKLDFIKMLQSNGHRVMMIGDGLNDAGALKQSDLGIAITDNVNNFSPGSDAILDGKALSRLPNFFKFSKDALNVVYASFIISLCYNVAGLSYAVSGRLSPLIAAILMPLSTVTIISFTSIATHLAAKKRKLL
ncbi:heavy metal translocating P-type ATPase [Mucilaginibacter sp.]|uniref:heavy metal translocating P-type ATPase n=1 Tax=Mucilaginibacter sp. TaxID=1882438 RepID=UPI002BCC2B89|nr:heavy metal translocating P-type ATPase metal-binding domain-containing protein [Mucilaginibacter sp.]HTI58750.1 heavy metal translocating P-type ATPase metal-binding domain-containing protein [Mucilaginibacter sp.]